MGGGRSLEDPNPRGGGNVQLVWHAKMGLMKKPRPSHFKYLNRADSRPI